MFYRSLGAPSFAGFWQYWNPVFAYGLNRYVFTPLKRVVPASGALLLTFIACGALHDLVTTLVRGSVAVFFIPWFFFLGIGVLLGHALGMNMNSQPWVVRAACNIVYILVCLGATVATKSLYTAWA